MRANAVDLPQSMPPVEAVVLDLGNVLVFHDDPILFQRMSAWGGADPLEIRARMLGLWDAINRGTLAGDELRRTICKVAGSDTLMDEEAFVELWNCHFRVHTEMLPILDKLVERTKVLLLTNVNERHWRYVRPLLPHLDHFHALVVSYDEKMAKPDRQIFELAIRRADVPADRIAYFDDVQTFVDVASSLGIAGRLFTDAPAFRRQLAELGIPV
jgi:putative hydrolase of the HAD superfamily